MGYVYYGNYPAFYEVGRTEALRQMGTSYHQMEERGVMMPVINMSLKYMKPGKYDDLLTIRTTVKEIPKMRMHFFYEVINEAGVLLNEGETVLAFVDMKRNRPVACPEWLVELFNENF
jgi:acyl-CoA thioester hydrolase